MLRRILIPLLLVLPSLHFQAATRGAHTDPPVAPAAATEPDPTSPDEVFAQMQHSFRAGPRERAAPALSIQFRRSAGREWWIAINDGAYTMGKGQIAGSRT